VDAVECQVAELFDLHAVPPVSVRTQ
jgi:hypothetical protein